MTDKTKKKMGRPRKYTQTMERYALRLEPKFYEKLLNKFGTLRNALEYAMEKKREDEAEKRKKQQNRKNSIPSNRKRV